MKFFPLCACMTVVARFTHECVCVFAKKRKTSVSRQTLHVGLQQRNASSRFYGSDGTSSLAAGAFRTFFYVLYKCRRLFFLRVVSLMLLSVVIL